MKMLTCRLAVVDHSDPLLGLVRPFGQTGSLQETWRIWCQEWAVFHQNGLKLTIKEVPLEEDKMPRGPRCPQAAYRGVWPMGTCCDFGEPGRRQIVTMHVSVISAHNQFRRILDSYGRKSWNIWLESRMDIHQPPQDPDQRPFTNLLAEYHRLFPPQTPPQTTDPPQTRKTNETLRHFQPQVPEMKT
jgi:hypothetical protein